MADFAFTSRNIRPLIGAIVRQYTADVALAPGDLVYRTATGVDKTDADAAGTTRAFGMVVPSDERTSYPIGAAVSVIVFGPCDGFSALTPGGLGFVSNTAARIADAAGTNLWRTGWNDSATVHFFSFGLNAIGPS